MKTLYLTSLLFLMVSTASAQSFERSVGIRLGYSTGFYFDKQNEDLSTYRFMMSIRDNGRHFTAMKYYRKYKLDNLPDYLSFYYGIGAHAGYTQWGEQAKSEEFGYYWKKYSAPVFGIDGLIGISYDFKKLPISLTADFKPFFDLWGRNAFNLNPYDFAIGAVYSF